MTELDDYLAAAAAYRKLCREGALATWLINNGFATSMLTARILAFALTDTREDATENAGRCDELEKQIIECIYNPFQFELEFDDVP
jgi:hypothetical protein